MSVKEKIKREKRKKPWLKFIPAKVSEHIEYPEIPLFDLLKNTAEKYSNNTIYYH